MTSTAPPKPPQFFAVLAWALIGVNALITLAAYATHTPPTWATVVAAAACGILMRLL